LSKKLARNNPEGYVNMNSDTLTILALSALAFLLIWGIITMVINRRTIGNFASLTAYHDFQTKDKQEAVEIVMEKKARKKMEDQENGDGKQ
jgi:hypothetical protein